MKTLLLLLALGAAAYYFYSRMTKPAEIENPVYVEIRIGMAVANRQLDFVLFGKMADADDCRTLADRTWGKIIASCPTCTLKVSSCKAKLEPRYARLFDDEPINTAYLRFSSSDPGERDGRMVIWGVTADEGNAVCEDIRAGFAKNYKGAVACVAGKAQ
jgi:hypothetical protein